MKWIFVNLNNSNTFWSSFGVSSGRTHSENTVKRVGRAINRSVCIIYHSFGRWVAFFELGACKHDRRLQTRIAMVVIILHKRLPINNSMWSQRLALFTLIMIVYFFCFVVYILQTRTFRTPSINIHFNLIATCAHRSSECWGSDKLWTTKRTQLFKLACSCGRCWRK